MIIGAMVFWEALTARDRSIRFQKWPMARRKICQAALKSSRKEGAEKEVGISF